MGRNVGKVKVLKKEKEEDEGDDIEKNTDGFQVYFFIFSTLWEHLESLPPTLLPLVVNVLIFEVSLHKTIVLDLLCLEIS